jgi:hypothetical protein
MRIKVTAPSRAELISYLTEVITDLHDGRTGGAMWSSAGPGGRPPCRWVELVEKAEPPVEKAEPPILIDFAGNPVDVPAMLRAIASIDWSRTPDAD